MYRNIVEEPLKSLRDELRLQFRYRQILKLSSHGAHNSDLGADCYYAK